ncbi:MAG TPA: hypothetical protein VIE36_12940 [Methylomirabilota bacterium]|jgi:hypothetical protein
MALLAAALARSPVASPLGVRLAWRLPLVALAVGLCYCFSWESLRLFTSEVALQFARGRGFEAHRLAPDTIAWSGETFNFGISCTFADVFCGAVPLLWRRPRGLRWNLALVASFGVVLTLFNLVRRCLTDSLFSAGIPWSLADEAIAGVAYLLVWIWVVRQLEAPIPHATV